MSEEIQSMHFGASKKQLSLHTGVYYVSNYQKTFCTVSENLQHGPAGIWAHLKPILKRIKQESPGVTSLEIFSDGPTTQYRQKGNFYLACTNLPKYGFQNFCWNFFEAGHGKGIPDAVGGALKRHADTEVKFGKDITNADIFLDCMSNSESVGYLVSDRDIQKEQKLLQAAQLKPIPGTMKLHQLIFQQDYEIAYRNISCTCQEPSDCSFCTGQEIKFSRILADKKQQEVKTKLKPQSLESPYAIDLTEEKGPSKPKKAKTEEHTNTELPFDKNEAIYSLKNVKSHRELKSRCSQLIKDLGTLESNPLMVNIMDQRMEVDAKAMDNYPDDVPDTRALYPCKVSKFKASEIRLRIVIELVQNEHLYLDNNFLLKGTTNTKSSKNLPTIYAQYSDMYLPGIHLTENIIRSIYQKEIMKIRLDKTYMGIWQIHALSSVLCTPIYSVYPKLENPNVRQDLNRLILPREYKHKQPIYIFWTSTRSADMNNEHWVPNHFVPILPIDNIIIEDNGRKESKEKGREVKNEEKSEEESKNQENNKGESENLENSNEESENEVNNKKEFENLENSTESENQENNKGESGNLENSTESENQENKKEESENQENNKKSENQENNKEEFENLENSTESENQENNKGESGNLENSTESENQENSKEESENQENSKEESENQENSKEESENQENNKEEFENQENNKEEYENQENSKEESENQENSKEESENQKNSKEESENQKNNKEESENQKNSKEESENKENSKESENLENNNEESENIENSTESEKVEKGEESAIAENKAEKSENVQKIEEKPKNVDEKEESKKKTEENPEKEESKEENEEESENVEKTEEKIKNQREKEIKVENAKQSDEESGKVENANEVRETIGNPSEIESHDCNDTNWKDVPDPSKCVGKYVVIKYDEKPYPGVVQDAGRAIFMYNMTYLEATIFAIICNIGINYAFNCSSNSNCICINTTLGLIVDCSGLGLTTVPLFTDSVISVNLSKNSLTKLPPVGRLPCKLKYLDLSVNMIKNFSTDRALSFSTTKHLLSLNLSYNRILLDKDTYFDGIFKNLRKLLHLDVSYNSFGNRSYYCPDEVFQELQSLQSLHIDAV
ncbi:unnamed protein product [Mytilus coruscus]|uniref:Uncharacterized protein n=1 Tax=Mytilus coruscus TaxID=42192 RepID=A0A6J8A1V4_MYTCO|nr:unnamed protein product [Mytilus coruscus]